MRAADGWEGEGRAAKGELRAKAEERTRMMHTFCSKYNVGEVPDPYYGGAQVRRRVCANARAGTLARATTCGSARMSCAALTASTPLPAAAHSHRYGLGRVSRPCSTCSMTPARGCLPTSTPSARSSWPACPHPPRPTPHRAAIRRCLLARTRRARCAVLLAVTLRQKQARGARRAGRVRLGMCPCWRRTLYPFRCVPACRGRRMRTASASAPQRDERRRIAVTPSRGWLGACPRAGPPCLAILAIVHPPDADAGSTLAPSAPRCFNSVRAGRHELGGCHT